MSVPKEDIDKCNNLINHLENNNKAVYDLLLDRVSKSMVKYTADQGYEDLFETMFEDNIYELLIKFWIIELKKDDLWNTDTNPKLATLRNNIYTYSTGSNKATIGKIIDFDIKLSPIKKSSISHDINLDMMNDISNKMDKLTLNEPVLESVD